jgi:hypothetical protein
MTGRIQLADNKVGAIKERFNQTPIAGLGL